MQTSLLGRPAPPFELDAVSFADRISQSVSLSSYAGRWLLLLFYPRDFSFVCPTELIAFSAQIEEFRSRGCEVLGMSVDSVADHLRWFDTPIDRGGIGPLQFPLGSDPEGTVSRAYGVWIAEQRCSARGLFLIDPAGTLQYLLAHSSSVGRSTEETLRVLDALQSGGLCPASWTSADGIIDAEEQLQAGRVLGHYRIVEKLGTGAFGSVFAADDLTLDRRVAIKIIGRKASIVKGAVLEEARAAAKLHHANICTVFAVETIDAVPIIVMEYIDGQTLSSLDLSEFDAATRKHIALGIAAGLANAHANHVVHGDLKPANIMISHGGVAKLLDFGLAKRGSMATQSDSDRGQDVTEGHLDLGATIIADVQNAAGSSDRVQLSGTPAYMSPEQTRGVLATMPSDVYAFGLILVELLRGRPVVQENNLFRVLEAIQSGAARTTALESVPSNFRAIVASMLAEAPEERPAMEDVVRTLADQEFDLAG